MPQSQIVLTLVCIVFDISMKNSFLYFSIVVYKRYMNLDATVSICLSLCSVTDWSVSIA